MGGDWTDPSYVLARILSAMTATDWTPEDLLGSGVPLRTPPLPHISLQTPPRATQLPIPPYTQSPGPKRRLHTRRTAREAWDPPPSCHQQRNKAPVPGEVEHTKAVGSGLWTRPHPRLLQIGSSSRPSASASVTRLRPLRRDRWAPGAPPPFPGKFLEICQRCFLPRPQTRRPRPRPPARAPRRPAARPAVLGRRGFREGLGRGGQKIRRLAPPRPPARPARPPGPPPAPARPAARAGAAQCAPAARAPRPPARELAPRSRASLHRAQLRGRHRRCRDMVLCVQG